MATIISWNKLTRIQVFNKYCKSSASGPPFTHKVITVFNVPGPVAADIGPEIIRAALAANGLRTDHNAILSSRVLIVVGLAESCRDASRWCNPQSPVEVICDCPVVPAIDTLQHVLKLCGLLETYLVDHVIQANVCISVRIQN